LKIVKSTKTTIPPSLSIAFFRRSSELFSGTSRESLSSAVNNDKKIKNDKDLGWCKPTKNMHTNHMKDPLILKFITSQRSFDIENSSLLKDPLILKVHHLIRKEPLISKELLIIGGAMVVCGRKSGLI